MSKSFERCIKSICNQTSPDFRVIVVCHEKPRIGFSHPHIKYVEVDFSVPGPDWHDKVLDKKRKSLTGLVCARELQPLHTMLVDADDCVSKYLAEFVNQNSECNGWFVHKGYEHRDGSQLIYLKKNFHLSCGTSNIIRYDLLDLPEEIKCDNLKHHFLKQHYFLNHKRVEENMKKNGTPLKPLPFVGAIYILGQDNISYQKQKILKKSLSFKEKFLTSAKQVYKVLNCRLLTRSIYDELGLYNIHDQM